MDFLNKLFKNKEYSQDQHIEDVSTMVHDNKNRIQEKILKFGNRLDMLAEESTRLSQEFKNSVAYEIYRATGGEKRTK